MESADDHLDESAMAGSQSSNHRGRHSPVPSVISMESDQSMDQPVTFTRQHEYISQHTTEPRGVLCAVCPKRAFKSCVTCMASFCEVHVKQHYTAPALQRHKLVEATEDLEQKLCSKHNRELELYCRTDQTPICVLCMAVEHTGHDITELGEHQQMQMNKSEMEQKTAVPPPGPVEFTSVKPDSVCVCWGPPEGLTGPHRFRVSWTGEGIQEQLEVEDLKLHVQGLSPGEKYTFMVATLNNNGRQSPCVAATVCTDIPPPEGLAVSVDPTSVLVTWSKPECVDQVSYSLTLSGDGDPQTFSTRSLQHRFSGLEIGREYSVSLSTVIRDSQSRAISKTINTSIPVPENLTMSSVTPTSAGLSWSLHQGMEQIPHSFLISYHSEGTEPQTISTESCSTTLTDLQPDTQYTVTVYCELIEGGRSQATTTLIQTSNFVPEKFSLDALDVDSGDVGSDGRLWSADLSWSVHQWMEQIPHSFLISYHSEGTEPQTISTECCSKRQTLTGLRPDTQYTVSVCTMLQGGKRSMSVSTTFHTSERRIVLLGKTGDGKSSAGNTILGEEVFKVEASQHSITGHCKTQSKIIKGRKITIIDTPGFFDSAATDEELNSEIVKCIFDSAPGPHAFIIVLRVGRYTQHEKQIINKIKELFSDDTFKYAVVLFTYGNELKGKNIDDYVKEINSQATESKRTTLKDLVDACQGRCHVIDNEHWRHQEEGETSNRTQLAKLFNTIEEMVQENRLNSSTNENATEEVQGNGGGYYTNELLMLVEEAIQGEMQTIREMQQDQGQQLSDRENREIREKAKETVKRKMLVNTIAATPAVLLFGLLYLPCIIFLPVRKSMKIAAAKAKNPGEAALETLSQLVRCLRNMMEKIKKRRGQQNSVSKAI